MSKPHYTIAVTGLNATDNPGPGLAVIRSLKEAASFDVTIIGLSYEALEPGIYLREFVDKCYQMPYPGAGQDVLMERLAYICQQHKVDFLFPNFDAELFNFIKLQQRMEQDLNIRMFLPTLEQFDARHKVNLYDFGTKHGIKVPQGRSIYSGNEIPSISTQLGFPLVVKGKFYDAAIAYNNEQAERHFNTISRQWGLPILLQEFIHGSEVNVCGIGDGKGNLMGAVPMRKLFITEKGKAWAGVSIDDEQLLEHTKKMVERTKWQGAFEMEFIKTVDDEYYLLEINPRFPAWCYLTVGAGQNQVEALVNLAMENEVKPFNTYKVGTLFIRYSSDLVVDIKEFEKISTIGEL
jgi:carbamoyl-phosphate synthase large subunit